MALGVLNNLSAIYAENNLNNTSNSLQNVLRQLSSGSRINSGADDAAGLSLVNGLQANSSALTQSKTNTTEGVGLLEVADGALSQVTSLLNRAITLATEASNGTLNSTQESAANQEYQSIMGEINNIGTTTTYNQQTVFSGQTISIYTGDSSTTGSSIDNLNIRTLSAASVGDTNGVMSYSDGRNNVFLNLSSSTANAQLTDVLNPSGSTSIDVNYLVKGAVGGASTASTQITVGNGTTYSNTVSGLISALNNAGLGLTASFTTQAKAGVTGGGMQTGIQIAGGLVSAGVDPSSASTSGILNPTGIPANQLLTQGQTITIKQGGSTIPGTSPITITPALNNLDEVAAYINNVANGYSTAVKASVITNGDGTKSLSVENLSTSGGALTVTTAPVNSHVAFGKAGTNAGGNMLSVGGSITLQNTNSGSPINLTFVVGSGTDNPPAGTYYTGNHLGTTTANSLDNLAYTINAVTATLGASAAVSATGITVTATDALTGTNIKVTANTLTNADDKLGLYSPVMGGTASTGTPTITALNAGVGTLPSDVFTGGGALQLTSSMGTYTFTANAGQTWADLAMGIQGSALGVNATWDGTNGQLLLTSQANGADPITVGTNTLVDFTNGSAGVVDDLGATGIQPGTAGTPGTASTAIMQLAAGSPLSDGGAVLTGSFTLTNGSSSQLFIMGAQPALNPVVGAIYTGATTVASLVTAINSPAASALGLVANLPNNGGTGGIYLQSAADGNNLITMTNSTLANSAPTPEGATTDGVTLVTGSDSVLTIGVAAGGLSTNDALVDGSSISITNNGVTHTFTVGAGTDTATAFFTANHGGSTLADLANTITFDSALGLTGQANTNGVTLTSLNPQGTPITVNGTPTLADDTKGSASTVTLGTPGTFASRTDTVSGTLSFSVGGVAKSVAVNANSTVDDMIAKINNDSTLMVSAAWVPAPTGNGFGNVVLTSSTKGTSGNISSATAALLDTTVTANLTYAAAGNYDVALSSDSGNVVFDSTSGQNLTTGAATFVSNSKSGSGAAVTSYSDEAGISLAGTSLLSQSAAQSALSSLNIAISDVASMDGYIGAQINMLNSISQVMSTQQENLTAAQNAIQATDYASATANMSKYEILSQTGIAALAQANTVQQEVTKLLQ
jgi:flagellin